MIQDRTLRVHDLDLHFLEAGDPEAPPVLLLHGWPTHSRLWRHALPGIARHRRVIALDLPGFGASSKPLDASYSFRFYDRVLTGFLEALGIERLGLVVHDLGGPIGLHWAVQNQQRVSDLVLMNTLVFPQMSWAVKAFVAASYLPGVRRLLSSPRGIGGSMRLGVNDRSRITDEVETLYTAPFTDRAARQVLLKTAHGLHPRGFETIEAGLAAFADRPVTLLYGEDDRILPDVAVTMSKLAHIWPHATVRSFPSCGHFLQEDRPQEVATALAGALRAHAVFGSVSKEAEVQLTPVSPSNLAAVLRIRVHPNQERFVAPTSVSLAEEAYAEQKTWLRAIEADGVVVGLVLVDWLTQDDAGPNSAGRPFLWRLSIDAQCQGRGLGRRALHLVIDALADRGSEVFYTSCLPGEHGPRGFYLANGFIETGVEEDGETVLVRSV